MIFIDMAQIWPLPHVAIFSPNYESIPSAYIPR